MAGKRSASGRENRSDEDRPRKKKRSGSRRLVVILLVVVLVGAALAGGTWLVITWMKKGGLAGSPRDQALRYLPDGLGHIQYTQVARLLADPEYPKVRALLSPGHMANLDNPYNIPIESVERIVEGGGVKGTTRVVTLKEPTTAAAIREKNTSTAIATSWSEEKVGGMTLHVVTTGFKVGVVGGGTTDLGAGNCFFMPDSKTVVFGIVRDLKPVMERKGAPPQLSPGLEKVLPQVDFGKLLLNVSDYTDSDATIFQDKPFSIDVRIFLRKRVLNAKIVHTDIGPEVVNTITYACKDPEGLKYLKETLESGIERGIKPFGPEAAELFKNQKVTVEGTTLTVRLAQSQTAVAAWLKAHPGYGLFLAD
jgi:hypothetical protein